jgi:hypothetical protein
MTRPTRSEREPVLTQLPRRACWALVATGLYVLATLVGPGLHLVWHADDHDHDAGGLRSRLHRTDAAAAVHAHSHARSGSTPPAHRHATTQPHTHHHLADAQDHDDRAEAERALPAHAVPSVAAPPNSAGNARLTEPSPRNPLPEHARGSLTHFASSYLQTSLPPLWLTAHLVCFALERPQAERHPPTRCAKGALGARAPPSVPT